MAKQVYLNDKELWLLEMALNSYGIDEDVDTEEQVKTYNKLLEKITK